MAAALNKIAATSPSRQHPSELETSIANALYDLESNIPDMKTALRPLQFVSAREVCHCSRCWEYRRNIAIEFMHVFVTYPMIVSTQPASSSGPIIPKTNHPFPEFLKYLRS
jgi:hypothetical protein